MPGALTSRLVLRLLGRPRLTVAVWAAAIAALGLASIGLEDRLAQTNLIVPGSESARHFDLAKSRFGGSEFVPVVLEGPPRALDAQGPRLAAALRRQPGVGVVSPWDGPRAAAELRPSGRAAMLLASVRPPDRRDLFTVLAPVERTVERVVRQPVAAHVTGDVAVGRGLNDASLEATRTAETIALPLLTLILLLVFRSPVAAGVPAVLGLATVLGGFGLLSLLARVFTLDAFGASVASMMGLALGVDYSLLMVSRFREQSPASRRDARVAAQLAAATAGRTVMLGGAIVVAAMALLLLLGPGSVVVSCAVGVIVAVLVAVVSAVAAIPAILVLLSDHLDRWSLGRAAGERRRGTIARVERRLARRPVILSAAIVAGLLALGGHAVALETTPPDVDLLPPGSEARQDFDAARRLFGPGYGATLDVIFVARRGAIAEPSRLQALHRLRRGLLHDPGVASVTGTDPVNVDERGQAARILIVPKTALTDPATAALRDRVARRAHALGERMGFDAAVGGSVGTLSDYNRATTERLPALAAALSGVTFVLLVVMLRALLLPLIAVALNLLTVGAAFGVLGIGFQGASPPLGGPGHLDVLALTGIFAIVFALSIDYQVFLLARMREGWVRSRDAAAAVEYGLRHTAKVIAGAAAIMTAVFVAFALTDFVTIRQFGVGLAVAVVLDAVVVRLVLLPALMTLAGRWTWWLPRWLDGLLPGLDVDGRGPAEPSREGPLAVGRATS